jgi:hypothetical protein
MSDSITDNISCCITAKLHFVGMWIVPPASTLPQPYLLRICAVSKPYIPRRVSTAHRVSRPKDPAENLRSVESQ